MRTITAVTVARSDLGIYLPVWRRIAAEPDLRLEIVAAGAHLVDEFGRTERDIAAAGFDVVDRVETLLAEDSPAAIAQSIGLGVRGFAAAFARRRPDLLLALGDRHEMLAAVAAALPLTIPVAHLHGGEISEGAIDDSIRHAITKMSHLHFVATADYRRRVIQLGEEPWRVTVSGAPGLDNLRTLALLDREVLERRIGMPLHPPPLLVTFHPVTLEYDRNESQIDELLAALTAIDMPVVFTYPGADAGSRAIVGAVERFVGDSPRMRCVNSLGSQAYFSLLRIAAAMVGNSSSGIIEAASFELPVVNVGNRQRGRLRAANVIDAECRREEIFRAIHTAVTKPFRESLRRLQNPYGDGRAAERIVPVLRDAPLDQRLLVKRFYDLPAAAFISDSATATNGP